MFVIRFLFKFFGDVIGYVYSVIVKWAGKLALVLLAGLFIWLVHFFAR